MLQKIIHRHVEGLNTKVKLIIYYKNRNMKNMIIRNRISKVNENIADNHHVVYQYTCNINDCKSFYVGYTTQTVSNRMRGHAQKGSIKKHLQQ